MPITLRSLATSLRRFAPALLLAALGVACGDGGTGPDAGVPESSLTFLRPGATAPALTRTTATFWAKRGEDREVSLYYAPRPGESDSSRFLEFEVPAGALERHPDGRAFAVGDSVLISVRLADAATLKVEFQPAGLRFSPRTPAHLEIEFGEADDDLDRDGDVDANDQRIETRLSIWRQEQPGQPWFRQGSVVVEDLDEIESDVFGFSAFAVAY